MKNKIYCFITAAIPIMWGVITACIMLLLWVFHPLIEYPLKYTFGLSNLSLTFISVITVFAFFLLYLWKKQRIDGFFKKLKSKAVIVATTVLFILQLIIFYNIFFKTDWDVEQILYAAEAMSKNIFEPGAQDWYYMRYPNNLLMTWIFSVIIRVSNLLGFSGEFQHIYAIIIVQCIIACVTAYLLFSTVRMIVKNPVAPYLAWAIYVFHVALNPTLTIPYSDSLSLIFPIAIFRIYLSTKNDACLPLKWCGIAVLSYLGYKIKPQVIIIFIAIVIYEVAVFLLDSDKRKKICKAIGYGVGAAVLCITVLVSNFAFSRLPVRLNDDCVFGFSHFLMMGLNDETGGTYSTEDVVFSAQFATSEERAEANFRVAKERLKEFGFSGFVKFMTKKALINFGNGTYSWGVEGVFYYVVPEEKNDSLSPFLRSLYYNHGENYRHFATFQQYMWITVLIGNIGILFALRDKKLRAAVAVSVLALIGLAMFEMLFEARMRYLFNYSPLFILSATVGWYAMLRSIAPFVEKIKTKFIKKEVSE